MAEETRYYKRNIEDWGSVTGTDVIADGRVRWADGVTGYNASEVIEFQGDGSTQISSLPKRQQVTDGAQTFYGVKTFDDIPLLPSTLPTSSSEAASKGYVDAQGVPAGFIYGLETSNAADADHDVTIATGRCRDYDDTTDLELTSAITKQIDATWAAGDAAGGLFNGTVAADTVYYLFLIKKDSDGSIDAGWDTDIDASNIPAGYTEYRRIWSNITDSSANIIGYAQSGDRCLFNDKIIDDNNSSPGTSRVLVTVTCPPNVLGSFTFSIVNTGSLSYYRFGATSETDVAASSSSLTVSTTSNSTIATTTSDVLVDSSRQVYYRSSDGSFNTLVLFTNGWSDTRGVFGGK